MIDRKKPWIREAKLYKKLNGKKVRCGTCERHCEISMGEFGFCRTRKNIDGELHTVIYGDISSISVNPIEKKPLFHFWPGHTFLTAGSWSCSFTCPWCLDPQTEILTAERKAITMEDLEKCWRQQEVLTCDWEGRKLLVTPIIGYFRIDPRSYGLKAYRLATKETGRSIVATEDHPFYTDDGIRPLRSLKIGDRVAVYPIVGSRGRCSRQGAIIKEADVRRALDLARRGHRTADSNRMLGRKVRYGTTLSWLRKEHDPEKLKYPEEFPTFDARRERATENLEGSELIWETVERIEEANADDVRDVTTALPTHNFFANGFLVSNCQNWSLSKTPPNPERDNYLSPEKFVDIAMRKGCKGTSLSFNEPTLLLEYAVDMFPIAHEKGMVNTYVSNGYMTADALGTLADHHMDAIKFDVKGDREAVAKYCDADVEVVWRNAREARKLGMHVEIVNLVIPGINDEDEVFREIANRTKELGAETPLHFTKFYPSYQMGHLPTTPVETLERAHSIAIDEGMKYVYIGNVPGHPLENTYCPNCNELLIKRWIFSIVKVNLGKGKSCPACGEKIPIQGEL
ncbi:MAG: radical SAM protein [Candidatus Bathyarchaeia archaeon]